MSGSDFLFAGKMVNVKVGQFHQLPWNVKLVVTLVVRCYKKLLLDLVVSELSVVKRLR